MEAEIIINETDWDTFIDTLQNEIHKIGDCKISYAVLPSTDDSEDTMYIASIKYIV